MEIQTASIRNKNKKSDGVRICIMRKIKPVYVFDMWIPNLSPSTKLLKAYKSNKIEWEDFEEKFTKQVLNKQAKYLKILLDISKENKVTLLCWEKKGENCHRLLIAKRLEEMQKGLRIKHV